MARNGTRLHYEKLVRLLELNTRAETIPEMIWGHQFDELAGAQERSPPLTGR